MCKVVGVTGGIAGGKSLFVSMLGEMGAYTLSADSVAKELLEPGHKAYIQVVDTFGQDILQADGNIDRKALADIIFRSETSREILNNITHPLVIDRINSDIELFRREHEADNSLMAVEVPLLFECGIDEMFDITVVVAVEQGTQISRLTNMRGLTLEQATERISAQLSDDEKCARADVIICNNGSVEALRENAHKFFQSICFPLL